MELRTLFSDNSTISDISVNANDYHTGADVIAMVSAEDKILIGSYFPFNHLYLKMGSTVNALASVMTIKYWDGAEFRAVAELIDETKSSGATLAQSGFITFVPHKKHSWVKEDTVDIDDNEEVTGLGTVKIYERYWIEITVSADLTAGTELEWIGNIFNKDDNTIDGLYPDLALSKTKTAYQTGKTDWEEQRVLAAEEIIDDLKKANIIVSAGHILERSDFRLAEVHKVAAIVYNAFGSARDEERAKASSKYKNALAGFAATIDKNENARSDSSERRETSSHGFR